MNLENWGIISAIVLQTASVIGGLIWAAGSLKTQVSVLAERLTGVIVGMRRLEKTIQSQDETLTDHEARIRVREARE